MNKSTTDEKESDGNIAVTTANMDQVTPNVKEERPIGASAAQIQTREYDGYIKVDKKGEDNKISRGIRDQISKLSEESNWMNIQDPCPRCQSNLRGDTRESVGAREGVLRSTGISNTNPRQTPTLEDPDSGSPNVKVDGEVRPKETIKEGHKSAIWGKVTVAKEGAKQLMSAKGAKGDKLSPVTSQTSNGERLAKK